VTDLFTGLRPAKTHFDALKAHQPMDCRTDRPHDEWVKMFAKRLSLSVERLTHASIDPRRADPHSCSPSPSRFGRRCRSSFRSATGYELLHDGKRYPPKAVVGLACRYSLGRMLLPEEFSGGEAPGQANFVLRKLGFTVVRKDEAEQNPEAARDWTEQEVRLILADCFAMLEAELQGSHYKKSEHRKALIHHLAGRSDGSVEFKHQNISSVLVEMGLPYVNGYKPRGNYLLDQRPGILEQLAAAPTLNPSAIPQAPSLDINRIIVDPRT
jgi:hypothetical protein